MLLNFRDRCLTGVFEYVLFSTKILLSKTAHEVLKRLLFLGLSATTLLNFGTRTRISVSNMVWHCPFSTAARVSSKHSPMSSILPIHDPRVYYPSPILLNSGDRTTTSVFNMVSKIPEFYSQHAMFSTGHPSGNGHYVF